MYTYKIPIPDRRRPVIGVFLAGWTPLKTDDSPAAVRPLRGPLPASALYFRPYQLLGPRV